MVNIKAVYEIIGQDVIRAYENVITNEGLIDSGLLLNSPEINITPDYEIEFYTVDYYKYLDAKYDLTNKIFNDPNFKMAEKKLEKMIEDIITEAFEQ
mgnify:FL=1